MNNTRIVVGDTDLDLPDNFSGIAQTLQGPNIGDLTTRAVNFTETITIPDTPTNQSVYEHANDQRSSTDVPYVKRSVKIIQNGIEVERNGIERLQSSGDGFSIYIQSGSALFFDTIGDKMLSDLDGFYLQLGDASETALRAATSGVIYPVTDSGNSTIVGAPFVYDLSILNNIISMSGYTGAGSIFTNPKFIKTSTGAFASSKGYVSSFIEKRKISVNVITPQNIVIGSLSSVEVNFTGVSNGGTNPYGYWDGTSRYITNDPNIPASKFLYTFTFRLVISITVTGGTVDIIGAPGSGTTFTNVNIATGVGSGVYSYELTTSYSTGISNGSNFAIKISGSGVTVVVNSGALEIDPLPTPLSSIYGSGAYSTLIYDNVAALLPDIKQKDFIKDIMISYGLIATENNRVITFTSFDEIISDTANALDWTNKRVPDKKSDIIQYVPFTYGQSNLFKYTNVDDLVNDNYALGSFDLANTNIQELKTIYTSIYSASRTSIEGNIISAAIELYDGSAITFPNIYNKGSNRKVLIRSKYSYEPSVTYMDGASYSDYKVAYFDDPNQTYSMKFQQFLDDNYPLFVSAMQKAKVCRFSYMLSETDIAGFDFTKLVFDNDTYYLVNKIFNFIPGKITQLQLFKV